MEELYINNIQIELKSSTVARTLQINDLGDVVDRQSNYSNNIKIPKSPNNIRAFEMLGISGNTTRLPYENLVVKYVVNGIELISEGKGVVKNTNSSYNLVVYDGNISMTDLLGDKQGISRRTFQRDLNEIRTIFNIDINRFFYCISWKCSPVCYYNIIRNIRIT